MEYIVETEQKSHKLTSEEKLSYAKQIADDFETYDNARKKVLEYAKRLEKEVYFKNSFIPKQEGKLDWKSKIKMCKMFMYFMTYKAFIWKNTYSGVNSMFDVSGQTMEADNSANQQKANLVKILEDMQFSTISDEVIEKSLIYGELISFSTWKIKEEEFRRPITVMEILFQADITKLPKIIAAKAQGKNYYIETKEIYNNAYITPVNPEDFVFDASSYENDPDSWPKIYRTWRTVDEIVNNKDYELSADQKKELRDMVKERDDSDLYDQSNKDDTQVINGSTIKVLDFYGTFTLKDGTTLTNWHAVVVADRFLVLFEKNKYIINPFTYGCLVKDPATKRGISPLYSGLDLALVQEKMLNQTVDLQSLNENKPLLAPKGFFTDKEIEMYPGKIIEFDQAIYTSSSVEPINFEASIYNDDIQYISETMSEVTGIFPNMMGQEESSRRTATEISTKVQGQTTRLSMTLDTIQQYYIIPAVKNVAKLNANFKFGKETIFFSADNKKEEVEIDDAVRQADYKYTYKDRNAINERFNYADMVILAIERFAKAGVPLDYKTTFTWYLEQKGVENPEKFLQQQVEIPLPVQQMLLQDPQVQQMCQQFMAQQQQGLGEPQASPETEMKQVEHFNQSPSETPMVM